MLSAITRRKKKWIGHNLRGQSLLRDVMGVGQLGGGGRVNGQGEEGELV